jgi:hypothetical protein
LALFGTWWISSAGNARACTPIRLEEVVAYPAGNDLFDQIARHADIIQLVRVRSYQTHADHTRTFYFETLRTLKANRSLPSALVPSSRAPAEPRQIDDWYLPDDVLRTPRDLIGYATEFYALPFVTRCARPFDFDPGQVRLVFRHNDGGIYDAFPPFDGTSERRLFVELLSVDFSTPCHAANETDCPSRLVNRIAPTVIPLRSEDDPLVQHMADAVERQRTHRH